MLVLNWMIIRRSIGRLAGLLVVGAGLTGADEVAPPPQSSTLQQQLEQTFGSEQPSPAGPSELGGLPDRMAQAGRELTSRRASEALQTQRQILEALDQWLQSTAPQPESTSGQPKDDASVAGASEQPSDAAGSERGPQGDGAARESTPGGHGARPTVVQLERRRGLATAVWGHLPDRELEQMLQSYSEDYLPEYADLVERYYEALAAERLKDGLPRTPVAP